MYQIKSSKQQGQTLVEAIVATGVVMILVTGLILGMTVAVKVGQSNKSRSLATKLAQEAVEQIRNQRDARGWNQFKLDYGSGGDYCMLNSSNISIKGPSDTCSLIINDGSYNLTFTRIITLNYNDGSSSPPERFNAYVDVSWNERGKIRSSKNETELTNWR
jgi:type II secretory pathway pseudopilin PulG